MSTQRLHTPKEMASIAFQHARSRLGMHHALVGVPRDSEFDRISKLPVADEWSAADYAYAQKELTQLMRRENSVAGLWPVQARALVEASLMGGLVGAIRVSGGKAQPIDEPVLTPNGWKAIGALRVGDCVIGSDGKPTRVTGVFPQGLKRIYRLRFSDGGTARSTADHLWTFKSIRDGKAKTYTLREWSQKTLWRADTGQSMWAIPTLTAPVQMSQTALPLDAYTLGALLGDGGCTQSTMTFTSMDSDIVDSLRLPEGVHLREVSHQNSGLATQYALSSGKGSKRNALLDIFRDLGLAGCSSLTKFVPQMYMTASAADRHALLQGILDTDGCPHHGGNVEYSSSSLLLARGVRELVRSLGGVARICVHKTQCADSYRMIVRLPHGVAPFRAVRRLAAVRKAPPRDIRRMLVGIERLHRAHAVCIAVEASDSLYVTRDYVLTHNTLMSHLIPSLPRFAHLQRPLVLVPSKTIKSGKFALTADLIARDWKVRDDIVPFSYSSLSSRSKWDFLLRYKPQIIILDEAHAAGRYDKSRRRRINRLRAKFPDTVIVCLSGTLIASNVVEDGVMLCEWALRAKSPLPRTKALATVRLWQRASDPDDDMGPGVLDELPGSSIVDKLGRRFTRTHGVVTCPSAGISNRLVCHVARTPTTDPKLLEAYTAMHRTREPVLPNGTELEGVDSDGSVLWSMSQTVGSCGFYYELEPKPPAEYIDAQRAWKSVARSYLKKGDIYHCDTESQVVALIKREQFACEELDEWELARPLGKGSKRVARWLSRSKLAEAAEWLLAHPRGLLWTQHVAFGEALARFSKRPYYGRNACDSTNGESILTHRARLGDGIGAIASLKTCAEDLDLQHMFHENMYWCPMASGQAHEQSIARTHRFGQPEELVRVEYRIHVGENEDSIEAALRRERDTAEMLQDAQRKLLIAKWTGYKVSKPVGSLSLYKEGIIK